MPHLKTFIFGLIILNSNTSCKDRLSTEAIVKSSEPSAVDATAATCSGTKNDSDKSAPSLTLLQLPPKVGDKITYKNREGIELFFTVLEVKTYRCPFCYSLSGCVSDVISSNEECKEDLPSYAVINTKGSVIDTEGRKMKSTSFQFKNANTSTQNTNSEVMDKCN